jgi:hypothetical protein
MPTGGRSDWAGSGAAGHLPQGLIYPELVHSGLSETLVQNTDTFNEASRNAIRLVTARKRGDFAQESFFKNVANIVNRRVVSSTSPGNEAVNSNNVPMDEHISVKLNRRIGPIDQTFDSFRKLGSDVDLEVLSFLLGGQIAKAVQVDQLDSGLISLVAALSNQAAVTIDNGPGASPQSTLDTNTLVDGLATFGDAAGRVVMWVMHSKVFFDLVKQQITANIDGISNFNVAEATPVTLNRPVLVTDSAALISAATNFSPITQGPQYTTLGLTENAVVLEDSEEEMMYTDVITGNENIVARLQGEFAYNVGCKGFRYDPANGGINPDDTALGTGTNWDAVMDSSKDFGGFVIRSQ